ncbi:MAG: 50S ribosomal protein L25 [Candidatus Omnitrophica bacterium]|nr:50S ribosomal protein L25 [Candidatus Omnitrophota bacterium]
MATSARTTHQQQLTVKRRTTAGKRPVRRLRHGGLVPGVIYGRDMEPMSVEVSQRELVKFLRAKAGEHALVTLRLEDLPAAPSAATKGAAQAGGKAWEKPALVQAVQHDPVDGHVVHVDFHAIVLTERLKVKVPLILKGEPAGVKQDGGVLEQFLREVEVECLPADLPTGVAHDVSAMKIGDTIHVRDLAAPKGARITSDPEGAIASVQTPKVEVPAAEEAAPVTEPEVIREKKEEAGEAEGEAAAKGEKPAEAKKSEPKKEGKG